MKLDKKKMMRIIMTQLSMFYGQTETRLFNAGVNLPYKQEHLEFWYSQLVFFPFNMFLDCVHHINNLMSLSTTLWNMKVAIYMSVYLVRMTNTFFWFDIGTSFDLSDKELFCIEEQDVFNSVYSLVRDFTSLPPALKFNLVEALRSNLSVLLPNIDSLSRASTSSPSDGIPITDRIASHRNALKIYSFFLLSIVLTQESSADSGTGAKVICA
jgi:hypothetical protein